MDPINSPVSQLAISSSQPISAPALQNSLKRPRSNILTTPTPIQCDVRDDGEESITSKACPNSSVLTSLGDPIITLGTGSDDFISFPSRLRRRWSSARTAACTSSNLSLPSDVPKQSSSPIPSSTQHSDSSVLQALCFHNAKAEPLASPPRPNSSIPPPCNPNDQFFSCEIPSPPSSSSDRSNDLPCSQSQVESSKVYLTGDGHQPSEYSRDQIAKRRAVIMNDESNPPNCSQDSAFFSFSFQSLGETHPPQAPDTPRSSQQVPTSADRFSAGVCDTSQSVPTKQPRYYIKAFNFVIQHVLERYTNILKPVDLNLMRVMKNVLSENALSLFVRLYRRKQPHWFRVDALEESYAQELDVEAAIRELCLNTLLISSKYAANVSGPVLPLLARELLPTLSLIDTKSLCSSVAEGSKLKKLPKNRLLPALRKILSDSLLSKKKRESRFTQLTLTGLTPGECLANAVLKRAGHCVCLPSNVLTSLARVHFLFFLDDGHDSPNVILADTGKVKFPYYHCKPSELIFLSARAYEDYEEAVSLECDLNEALETHDFDCAAYIGSIAELEVREFFRKDSKSTDCREKEIEENCQENVEEKSLPTFTEYGWLSRRPTAQREYDKKETEMQLKHPFFKRFTAVWVYVRACWHSVQALERLNEHESAIARLKLLLTTDLMARRRGKCLNRLTINLFKHVHKLEEALETIIDALGPDAPRLNYGDRMQLAQRGAAIHRKVHLPVAETKVQLLYTTAASRKKAALAEVIANRPRVIAKVLEESETQIAVRKIFGKSLNIQIRERRSSLDAINDSWQRFLAENNRDSTGSMSTGDRSIMGKSKFRSLRGDNTEVSVEEYCLEWYFAKDGWSGNHTEGSAIRFMFGLLMWESVIFKNVADVFQTPYQSRPLDMMTEAFFESRKEAIFLRIEEINVMSIEELHEQIISLYDKYDGTRAVGCNWDNYSKEDLACIACGLGSHVVARCCTLLCEDYGYWAGGLPDLTLWKTIIDGNKVQYKCKLVEVKSARDHLSEKQRAWLFELTSHYANCEVCKVVEKVTQHNETELKAAELGYEALNALSSATAQD